MRRNTAWNLWTSTMLLVCATAGLLGLAALSYGEAVKWVDENGKVHYGDRLPDGHTGESETIELKQAPKQGLTEQELREQKKRVADYKASLKKTEQRTDTPSSNETSGYMPPTPTPDPRYSAPPAPPTREECRNMHPSKVKERVRCFKAADAADRES